ncbi:hypothetical protein [Streptomyces sp. NPDC017529]|uniref:hypothetical protein n=1 Tax=Streptomyces sp. NPDC017529 TaxID=3365000 RepID=UPI0037AF0840
MTALATPSPGRGARRPHHPLASETRSGIAPWTALAVFVALAVVMASKAKWWQGGWSEAQFTLHSAATLLGGPLAAAVGCRHGGRERRARMDGLRGSAVRSPLAQFAVSVLPVAVAVVLGYSLAAAGTLLATWPYTSAGRPRVLPLVGDAAFLAAATAGAVVVGRLVRWRPAALVFAGLTYVALALPAYHGSAVRFLSPAVDGGVGEALPVWWQPVVMAGWAGGLAVAAVLAYTARRPSHRCFALLPLAVAVPAAVLLVLAGSRAWQHDPAGGRQVCDGSVPRVCVNALDRGLLPQVSRALSGVTGRLAGVRNAPVRFEDLPRATRADEARLPQLSLGQSVVRGKLTDPERFAWEAAAGMTSSRLDACGDAALARFGRVDDAVRDWLVSNGYSERRRKYWARAARESGDAQRVASAEADARAFGHLASMDDERRREWLSRYFASVKSCDARKVPRL